MVLSKQYLRELIRIGIARYANETESLSLVKDDSKLYVAVDRLDKQRVDHYLL